MDNLDSLLVDEKNDKAFEKDRCEIARKLFGFWVGGILWLGLRTKAFLRKLNFLKR